MHSINKRTGLLAASSGLALIATALVAGPSSAVDACNGTFSTAGNVTCTVPAGTVTYTVVGGNGGAGLNMPGGTGAKITGTIVAAAGTTLYLTVGANGGGNTVEANGAGGGGAYSSISTVDFTTSSNAIAIAGAGGGAGGGINPWSAGGNGFGGTGGGGNGRSSTEDGNGGLLPTGGAGTNPGAGGAGGDGGNDGSPGGDAVSGFMTNAGGGAGFAGGAGGAGNQPIGPDTLGSAGGGSAGAAGATGYFAGGGGSGYGGGGGGSNGSYSGGGGGSSFVSGDGVIAAGDGSPRIVFTVSGGSTPAPATSVEAKAGDKSATVSWKAPDPSTGVTGYVVETYLADGTLVPGVSCTATHPALSCRVTGLQNGVSYKFKVVTKLGAETGPASEFSNVVIPAKLPFVSIVQSGKVKGSGKSKRVNLAGNTRKKTVTVYIYRAVTRNGPARLVAVKKSSANKWKAKNVSLGGRSSAFFCARVGTHFSRTIKVSSSTQPAAAARLATSTRGDFVRCP